MSYLTAGETFLPTRRSLRSERQLRPRSTSFALMLGIALAICGCEGGPAVPGPNDAEYYVLIGRLNEKISMPGGSRCGAFVVPKDQAANTFMIGSEWSVATPKYVRVYDITKKIGPFTGVQQAFASIRRAGWVVPVNNTLAAQDYSEAAAGC